MINPNMTEEDLRGIASLLKVTLNWTREDLRGIASILQTASERYQESITRESGARNPLRDAILTVIQEEKALADKAASALLRIVAAIDAERG